MSDALRRPEPRNVPLVMRLGLVLLVALATRLVALPGSTQHSMEADSPHLMNIARCFQRGEGFANVGAWPAWMKPERLPMPETFKEPGYPWAIAQLAPIAGGEFPAGVLISLLAGLVTPLALYALARNLGLERGTATLAALLTAASPLGIVMSVKVTVDSLFPCLLTAAFALATWRRGEEAPARPPWTDGLTGVVAGLAFMVRGQTLVAVPALLLMLAMRRPGRARLAGVALAALAAVVTASPFLLRNLRLFGVPFHSDVGAYGLWPYVDHITFSHGLDRPPPPIEFALTHVPQVLAHMAESVFRFCVYALPGDITGHPVWMVPLAAGLAIGVARWQRLLPVWVYVAATLVFIFAINWDGRYFTSTVPLWSMFTALGAMWLWRALAPLPLAGALRGRHLLVAALVVALVIQAEMARREAGRYRQAELAAILNEAPFLRARLAPDEAVMVITTSFWSWFLDRPSVHLIIAGEPAFGDAMRRLKVRWAALPTSRLPLYAERYPGGRLPASMVVHHTDPERDITVFRIDPDRGR